MQATANFFKNAALWLGVLLILLPMLVLWKGFQSFADETLVGLPIVAILGICALFGACALVAVVFAQFGLSDTAQPLALPEGCERREVPLRLSFTAGRKPFNLD